MTKTVAIGVMSQDRIRERVLAIARGDHKPGADEPKVWFPSSKAVTDVLKDGNPALLKAIQETKPEQ